MTRLTNEEILDLITMTAQLHINNKNNKLLTKTYNLDSKNLYGCNINERIEIMKEFQVKCRELGINEKNITCYNDNEYKNEILTANYTIKSIEYSISDYDYIIKNALSSLARLTITSDSKGNLWKKATNDYIKGYIKKEVEEMVFLNGFKEFVEVGTTSLDLFRDNRIDLVEFYLLNNGVEGL